MLYDDAKRQEKVPALDLQHLFSFITLPLNGPLQLEWRYLVATWSQILLGVILLLLSVSQTNCLPSQRLSVLVFKMRPLPPGL